MKSILREHQLWDKSLDRICEKASTIIVKTIMYTPTDGEYVKENATLEEAIHQLIMGRHQSLLVTRNKGIVGILRLTDVFREIGNRISACSEYNQQ
jgi:CBS domain containing-hemolysin-like protein